MLAVNFIRVHCIHNDSSTLPLSISSPLQAASKEILSDVMVPVTGYGFGLSGKLDDAVLWPNDTGLGIRISAVSAGTLSTESERSGRNSSNTV